MLVSKEYLKEHLTALVKRYRYRSIYFDDDTMNLCDKHTLNVCEVMTSLRLPWTAMCRADTIKRDTWRAMKESGCVGVKLGFESGNQWVIDNIVKKNLNLAEAKDTTLFLINDLKLKVHGTFTFGLPGETEEQMQDTLNYIDSIPFYSIQKSGCGVMSGTELSRMDNDGLTDGAQKLRDMMK